MAGNVRYLELLFTYLTLLFVGKSAEAVLGYGHGSAAYDELYADGLSAYFKDDWPVAIAKFEEAIADWKQERNLTIICRTECMNAFGAKERRSAAFAMDYFRYMNHMRNCSSTCLRKNLGLRLKISKHTRELFELRVPFSFLQYAYHRITFSARWGSSWSGPGFFLAAGHSGSHIARAGNNTMAARAASTFLRFQPQDPTVKANMKFYKEMPELKDVDIDVILAPVKHHELYEKGRIAYNEERWVETVNYFEEALKEYIKAYKECQMFCDIELENHHQYIPGGVYGFHAQLLLCRLGCPKKLSMLLNFPQPGYLSKHFDFLHFAYYKLDQLDKAIECAVTFMLLNPESKHMKSNIEYYQNNGISTANANPRKDGQYFYEDIREQMELLRNVKSYLLELDEEYKGDEDLEDETFERYLAYGLYPDEPLPETTEDESRKTEKTEEKKFEEEKKDVDKEPYKRFPPPTKEHIQSVLKTKDFKGASLTMMEQQLNGSYRVVIDGLATQEECKKLMHLGLSMGHSGDGYDNKPHPHTVKEEFFGVNVNNATWAAAKGEVDLEYAELYVNLSEKVRQLTEAYFRLTTPLFFSYTHLVCRKAISDPGDKDMHISHPIHSDNCILKGNKVVTCVKEYPAYTWRDYSAILYLNNDFTGGQFIFAASNRTVEAIVRPKCGRMVAFSAGFENLHGVLGIKQGTRCTLPIWFTLDKEHDEKQRHDANQVLRQLRKDKHFNSNSPNNQHKEL